MNPPFEKSPPWLPYVAPMAVFLVLTTLEGWLPEPSKESPRLFYPPFYAFKITLVALTCWFFRSTWRDLRPWPGLKSTALAIGLGLVVTILWVVLDGWYPVAGDVGKRAGFDPNVLQPMAKSTFLTIRLMGLVLIVPLFEELFWRSFVVRWIIDPDDFQKVPIGKVTPIAAAITAALFGLEHPAEWLPALLTGGLWAWLLKQTRSVSACFLSHAVANLGLGVYVLVRGEWKFW
jgi:CAAX prenyl protease-like protein